MSSAARGTSGFRDFLLKGIGIVLVIVVGGFLLAQGLSERRRAQSVRSVTKPENLERYDRLASEGSFQPLASSTGEATETKSSETPSDVAGEWGSPSRLARWKHLFARWEHCMADTGPEGWRAAFSILASEKTLPLMAREGKPPRELSEEEWALVAGCMSRQQDLVREILEVAQLGGPPCALDLSGWADLDFPHHEALREMAGFLAWDANVKARAGDVTAAVDSLVGGIRLSHSLMEEPLLLSQLVRMSICREVEWGLCEGIEAGQLPPGDLRRVLDELGKANRREAFADAMRSECYLRMRAFDSPSAGKKKSYGVVGIDGRIPGGFNSTGGALMLRAYTGPLGTPLFNLDQAALFDAMQRIADAVERPYYEARPVLASIEEESSSSSITHFYRSIMLSGYDMPPVLASLFECKLDLARMGLLIEQYRTQHGVYPPSLEEIAADLGGRMPVDPFSGQPYRYVVKDGAFLLYSVGENQRDDAGASDRRNGDIVWRQ